MLLRVPFSCDETSATEIASDYSLAESVERLRAVIVPRGFDAESTESVMGSVSQQHVRLEHNVPWSSSVNRPYFVGSFRNAEQGVVLSGNFIMSRHADRSGSNKFLLWILLPFCIIATLHNPQVWPALLLVLYFFWAGQEATKRHRRRFQEGAEWLSAFIKQTLSSPPSGAL